MMLLIAAMTFGKPGCTARYLEDMPSDQVKACQAGVSQILCQLPKVRMPGCLRWVCGQPGCQLQTMAILQQIEISLEATVQAVAHWWRFMVYLCRDLYTSLEIW